MTTEISQQAAWVPDACTLPTVDQAFRQAEFDDLFAGSVEPPVRTGTTNLRLTFAGGPDLEAMVRDLAARENECCAFFTFGVATDGADRVVLDIGVPDAYVDVIEALAARAELRSRTVRP
jgi:hypothetical protein